jgi:hypothetical protein
MTGQDAQVYRIRIEYTCECPAARLLIRRDASQLEGTWPSASMLSCNMEPTMMLLSEGPTVRLLFRSTVDIGLSRPSLDWQQLPHPPWIACLPVQRRAKLLGAKGTRFDRSRVLSDHERMSGPPLGPQAQPTSDLFKAACSSKLL